MLSLEECTDAQIERLIKPTFYENHRAIRRRQEDLFNKLCSVFADYAFVEDMVKKINTSNSDCDCDCDDCYRNVFANLRCGAWYANYRLSKTCVFKSIDGHNQNHQFSKQRLNIDVVLRASLRGGYCAIVDATKSRTKRFPDALGKTVPIWAAVINRAVAFDVLALRRRDSNSNSNSDMWDRYCDGEIELHEDELPEFVSENELSAIRVKMKQFVKDFKSVCADDCFKELVEALARSGPLLCKYVSRNNAFDDVKTFKRKENVTCLYLISASKPLNKSGERCLLELDYECNGTTLKEKKKNISYQYFPGAADDEETWSLGLTPKLFQEYGMEKLICLSEEEQCESLVKSFVVASSGRASKIDDEEDEIIFQSLKNAFGDNPNIFVGTFETLLNKSFTRDDEFKAVLYVGQQHTPNFTVKSKDVSKTYLHVPLKKHKEKRGDIERLLPRCVDFLNKNSTDNSSIFVCCDDAKDLSIGVIAAYYYLQNKRRKYVEVGTTLKEDLRKILASIQHLHPISNPSQGTMKEVSRFIASTNQRE